MLVAVYDIKNCGPRHRFVANGKLVHNSDGINLQNLPSRGPSAGRLKKAIKAPPGYVMIDCDSAQIEARVLAWLAGQEDLIQAFRDKQDVYKLMASKIYGIPPDQVTTGAGSQRQVGKTVVLGCFGADTKVLTNRGWTPIIQVLDTDTVWDGESWVQHQGVVPQGEKEVLTTRGLSATADHEILTEHGWVEWCEVLANHSHLESALSLASSLVLGGIADLLDLSGAASTDTSQRCGARAGGKASWTEPTSVGGVLRGVTHVLKRKLNGLARPLWGLRPFAPMPRTESGYSLESARSLAAAQTPVIRFTQTTGGGGLMCTRRGLRSAWSSCGISSGWTAGVLPSWSLTVGTTIAATFRAIFGLSAEGLTTPTEGAAPPEKSKPFETACSGLKQRMHTYDIAYAGPRNRYTVLTSDGPIIVHNCGFGVGHVKVQAFLKAQAGVSVTSDEAKRIVDTYRHSVPGVVALWKKAGEALQSLMNKQTMQVDVPGLVHAIPGKGLTMPNGLHIQYPELRTVLNKDDKREVIYTSKGLPVRIYGAKAVENFTQGIARCVVAEQMLRIQKRYPVVLCVHDAAAIVAPIGEADEARAYVEECMNWVPKWATGLPLACESGMGASYGDC